MAKVFQNMLFILTPSILAIVSCFIPIKKHPLRCIVKLVEKDQFSLVVTSFELFQIILARNSIRLLALHDQHMTE